MLSPVAPPQVSSGRTLTPVAASTGVWSVTAAGAFAETPSDSATVRVVLPLVPSTVIAYSPDGNAAPPVSVSTLDPGALIGLTEKLAVAPAGTLFATRLIAPVKPFRTPARSEYAGSVEVVAPQS